MTLSEMIKHLQDLEAKYGKNVPVVIYDDFGLGQPFTGAKPPFADELLHVEAGDYTYGDGVGVETVIRLK